jgi:hypothetical protein
MMRLLFALALLAAGCSGALTFRTDRDSYVLPADGVVVVAADLTNSTNRWVSYDPCNFETGQSTLGYSSLERRSEGVWTAAGLLVNQWGPGCSLKVGCGLEPSAFGSPPPHSNASEFCRFGHGLDSTAQPGTYRFVTTVASKASASSSIVTEQVISNTFEVTLAAEK